MEALQRLQPLDFLLVVLWAGIIAWGVRTGLIRQFAVLLGTYVGAIVAGQGYQPFGYLLTAFGPGLGMLQATQWIAYTVLFFLVLAAITLGSYIIYRHTQLAGESRVDTIGGGVLAAFWGLLLLMEMDAILSLFALVFWPDLQDLQLQVRLQVARSQMIALLEHLLPPLWALMSPWLPEAVRQI